MIWVGLGVVLFIVNTNFHTEGLTSSGGEVSGVEFYCLVLYAEGRGKRLSQKYVLPVVNECCLIFCFCVFCAWTKSRLILSLTCGFSSTAKSCL